MNAKETRKFLVDGLDSLFRFTFGWLETNEEALGRLVEFWHLFIIFTLFALVFISHVIYPVFWFQVFVFGIVLLIWLQHILIHACIFTALEVRWLGLNTNVAIDVILNLFSIPVSRETRSGVTVFFSTLSVILLGLELVARMNMSLREYLGFSTVA